ncbi:MAG: hypothetical protein GY952_14065 [Rhodobacteraceae bacterium]|nr:hypothetical protein [Paracoccaceae bacterium]
MNRRKFLSGAAGVLAAPAIVQITNIMPVVFRPLYSADWVDIVLTGRTINGSRHWYDLWREGRALANGFEWRPGEGLYMPGNGAGRVRVDLARHKTVDFTADI